MRPLGLSRRRRIRSPVDYQRIFDSGHACRDGAIVAHVSPSRSDESRVGTSVSKRGRTGVQRNQIRRMLREAFRLERPVLPHAQDWILSVARDATRLELAPTRASLVRIGRRVAARNKSAPPPGGASPTAPRSP